MFNAEVGDDVFGDDPTVHLLESKLSSMFEKESALFFPSGTMSNLAAAMSWCGTRGSEMILGDNSHMFLYEQGGISQLAGILPRTITNQRDGTISLDSIERAVRQSNIHFPVTELIALENTHNFCGGRVLPKGYMADVSEIAKNKNIRVHLDGARIWNAATASGVSLSEIVDGADSVSVCLSKGLGAPSGSLLLGPKDFIERARRCRKVLGGGMRQVGILAAAGLQAVNDFESGILIPDHLKAKLLANAITDIPGFSVDCYSVDTNIILVIVDEGVEPSTVANMLKERGVLALAFGERSVRLVLHRDIIDEDIDVVLSAFRDVSINLKPRILDRAFLISSVSIPPNIAPPEEGVMSVEVVSIELQDEEANTIVEVKVEPVQKRLSARILIAKTLENDDIFRPDLTQTEIDSIVDAAQGVRVSSGDVVIRKGDLAEYFYIIETGSVDFYLEGNGEYVDSVKCLRNDSFFGEMALMYDAPRAASVLASEETILWRIHKKDFFSVQKSPGNKLGYFKTVSEITEENAKSIKTTIVSGNEEDVIEVYTQNKEDESGKGESVKNEVMLEVESEIRLKVENEFRLSIAEAQAEALRTAKEPGDLMGQSPELPDDSSLMGIDHEGTYMGGSGAESTSTWEEEELQGIESGGQAVSLSEDDYEDNSLQESDAISDDDDEILSAQFYEEAVIHSMSLSDDGFCVLLRGVVCDRVVRVLVTPSDPMADGLDVDQVETPEAVTLLQLLQGIDVESVLARDALATKFAESGPGKQQYSLQRVIIDGITTSKTFHARLLGSALVSSGIPSLSSIEIQPPISVVPQHTFDHPVFETLASSIHLPLPGPAILINEVEVYPPEIATPSLALIDKPHLEAPLTSQSPRQGGSASRRIDKEVEIDSAFEAIALVLRHSAVVEVRSTLLQDEHFSYSLDELPSFFPKLVPSNISVEEHGRFGADYDSWSEMERLQRQLFEAIRQGNNDKIYSIKRQLEFYSNIEGRSVLVLPPPHLALAPDIQPPPHEPSDLIPNNDTGSNLLIDSAPLPPSYDLENSSSLLTPDNSFNQFDGSEKGQIDQDVLTSKENNLDSIMLPPFSFDSRLDQEELELHQLNQEDSLNEGFEIISNQVEKEEDMDDLIGEQLKKNYNEDNSMDIWQQK